MPAVDRLRSGAPVKNKENIVLHTLSNGEIGVKGQKKKKKFQ